MSGNSICEDLAQELAQGCAQEAKSNSLTFGTSIWPVRALNRKYLDPIIRLQNLEHRRIAYSSTSRQCQMKGTSHCAVYTARLLYLQSDTSNSNDTKAKSSILAIGTFIWPAPTLNVKYLDSFASTSLSLSIDLPLLTPNSKSLNRCMIRRYCRRVSRLVTSFIARPHNAGGAQAR